MIPQNIGSIIIETAPPDVDDKVRAKVVGEEYGYLVVEAILQDMNKKNRNGRFYATEELAPQVTCKRTQELINSGNFKGENGHPMSKDLVRQQTIDPNNVVCKFLKVWVDGDLIKAQVTATVDGVGDSFEKCVRAGELPSYSMRSLGSLTTTSRGAEVKNIRLITWDRVIFPSHEVAYTCENGVYVPEQKEIVAEGSRIYLDENDKGIVIPFDKQKVINYVKSESKNLQTVKESMECFFDTIDIVESGKKVMMKAADGNTLIINLEDYISNEIMDYCSGIIA
jgi:hypothetical protein